MCGICAELLICINSNSSSYIPELYKSQSPVIESLNRLVHRGPDCQGYWTKNGCTIGHTRLSIMNPNSGRQPIVNDETGLVLSINGEIYNYSDLLNIYTISKNSIRKSDGPYTHVNLKSDCDVLTYMFSAQDLIETEYSRQSIISKLSSIRGMFAFVLVDKEEPWRWIIARDPIGIIPLYIGYDENRPASVFVASEMKALENCQYIKEFEPGTFMTNYNLSPQYYYKPLIYGSSNIKNNLFTSQSNISENHLLRYSESNFNKEQLEQTIFNELSYSVKSHLMTGETTVKTSDTDLAPSVGVLLSGGLDSSIIAALTREIVGDSVDIHTFSIGLENSPDLKFAREMAKHINSIHHEVIFTVDEAFNALDKVIYHIETYDTTTVRASTPMLLMAERIKQISNDLNLNIKVILSGEGADEIFGGYLYFRKAPNPIAFQEELERKVSLLSYFDCLRANKSMMAYGLELRVPFLDTAFVNFAMSIPAIYKMCRNTPEKQILRNAFKHLLPESIYTRQKEQFSDGVGYDWIDELKKRADVKIKQLGLNKNWYPVNTPQTSEQLWYRYLFTNHFVGDVRAKTVHWDLNTIACSTGKVLEWDNEIKTFSKDPSGRSVI